MAARLTSFSKVTLVPNSRRTASTSPWRPQPGRFGAISITPRSGSKTPGLPRVAAVTWFQRIPASAASWWAMEPICPIRLSALRTWARSWRRATIAPEMLAIAARTHCRPTSIPTTHPAEGLTS